MLCYRLISIRRARYNEPSKQQMVLKATDAVRSGQANLDITNPSVPWKKQGQLLFPLGVRYIEVYLYKNSFRSDLKDTLTGCVLFTGHHFSAKPLVNASFPLSAGTSFLETSNS